LNGRNPFVNKLHGQNEQGNLSFQIVCANDIVMQFVFGDCGHPSEGGEKVEIDYRPDFHVISNC
jgi:hypothetical protein